MVAMAGLAAEGLTYDKVIGQSADLFSLQVYNYHFPKINCFLDTMLTQSQRLH